MLSCEQSPDNPDVTHAVFRLPPGVGYVTVAKNADKLKSALAAAFCVTQPGESGDLVEVWSARTDPMPAVVELDYDAFAGSGDNQMPLGVGIDGSPVVADFATSPHLLVCGVTGGGKSSALQQLVIGAVLKGWPAVVLDPAEAKQGADYSFAAPYLHGLARDLEQAESLAEAVAAEVRRRGALNAAHGVSHVKDLPEHVRPPRLMVLLDEFVSIVLPGQVPKSTGNPLSDQRREDAIAANERRARIGEVAGQIAREGRATGVVLVISALKLLKSSLEAVPGGATFREQLARVFLGTGNYSDWQVALNNPDNMPDMGEVLPPGRGVFEAVGRTRPAMCQFAYEPGGQAEMARQLAARVEPVPQAERWDAPAASGQAQAGQIDLTLDDLDLDLDLDMAPEALEPAPEAAPGGPRPEARPGPENVSQGPWETPGGAVYLGSPAPPGATALTEDDLPAAAGDQTGWPLLEAVAAWLEAHPDVGALVWRSPRLAETDALTGLPWADIARDHLPSKVDLDAAAA
jgi:hypothetical protein